MIKSPESSAQKRERVEIEVDRGGVEIESILRV